MPLHTDYRPKKLDEVMGNKGVEVFTFTAGASQTPKDTAIGEMSVSAVGDVPSAGHRLQANYPNPFNPRTVIPFDLAPGNGDASVRLEILDLRGRVVATVLNGPLPRGQRHTASWDGTDRRGQRVASGIYFYRMTAGDFIKTRKMLLIK